MIYGTVGFLFCLAERDRKPRYGMILPLFLLFFCASFTAIYLYTREPLFHQVVYVSCVVLTLHLSRLELARVQHPDASRMLWTAFISVLVAAVLWLVDNTFCGTLRQARSLVPFPFDALLQLHGWWHMYADWVWDGSGS